MTPAHVAQFICPACGKHLAWKAQLAGRKAKCRCGRVIDVPATPDAAGGAAEATIELNEPGTHSGPTAANPASSATSTNSPRCPSCGDGMVPGTFVCIGCGLNLKTGRVQRTVGVAPPERAAKSQPATAASTTWAVRPKPRRAEVEPSRRSMWKFIIPIGALLLLVGGIVGYRMLWRHDANIPSGPMLGQDEKVYDSMKRDGATEAVEWLKGSDRRMVMGMTRERAVKFADRQYDLGAKKVLAFGGSVSTFLAIELPEDPARRQKLFDWAEQWNKDMNLQPEPDVGQKYIILQMRVAL